jgi:hypothetical protein
MVEQPMLNRSATRGKINILWKILAIVFALCIATAAVLYYTKPSSQEFSAYIATKGIPPGVLYFQIKSPFYYSDNCVFDGKEITHRYIGVFGHFYEVNPPKKGETSGKEPQVLRSHVEQRRIKNQNDLGCTGDTHVAEHRREVAELVCQQVGHD